jgi:hypothetical protein
MDRAHQPPMTIHIMLPEDLTASKPARPSTIRHCGQAVDGHLEVTVANEFVFEIDVSFEGC